MKKKFFGSLAIIAIAAMTAFNVNIKANEDGLSDILLDNIEALAQESIHGKYQTMGYCSNGLNYMCVTRHTAESCRRNCP